jgi:UPF0271 protein
MSVESTGSFELRVHPMAQRIDLNADLGEGMDDAAILPFITSANVACGLHAGDPMVIDRTVELSLARGVRIGAHPGYADRQNFGRVDLKLSSEQLSALLLYQLAALDALVRARGGELSHVKPHGALYNQAAKQIELARTIAGTVRRFRSSLVLVGLCGSKLIQAAEECGLPVAREAFADRRYLGDGTLMPRTRDGSVIDDPEQAAAQAALIATQGTVIAEGGQRIPLEADTVCLHGDTPSARVIAAAIRARLEANGVAIRPLAAS